MSGFNLNKAREYVISEDLSERDLEYLYGQLYACRHQLEMACKEIERYDEVLKAIEKQGTPMEMVAKFRARLAELELTDRDRAALEWALKRIEPRGPGSHGMSDHQMFADAGFIITKLIGAPK